MTETNFAVRQENPAPFFLPAGPVGVVLLHGFTGTPREMQPLGEYLHAHGVTVSVPLLPGHGGTLEQMNRSRWRDWVAGAEAAYVALKDQCARCFVAGFSMGALLALWIAEHDAGMVGLVLYSPPLKLADWRFQLVPLARHFVRSIPVKSASDLRNPEAAQWSDFLGKCPALRRSYHTARRAGCFWRRGWDLNPWSLSAHALSRRAH